MAAIKDWRFVVKSRSHRLAVLRLIRCEIDYKMWIWSRKKEINLTSECDQDLWLIVARVSAEQVCSGGFLNY